MENGVQKAGEANFLPWYHELKSVIAFQRKFIRSLVGYHQRKCPSACGLRMFCADGFYYKRNSPDKRPVTEAKMNEVGARQLSMHACKINSAQKLLHDVTYGYIWGFFLLFI